MSEALLDHGEMVPKRGTTRNSRPLGSCTGTLGPYFSSRASTCSLVGGERAGDVGEMRELSVQPGNGRYVLGQLLEQFAVAESGKGGSAAQDQHCRNSLWRRKVGPAGPQRPCILP